VNGGVGDLIGNGTAVDSSLSAGLQAIAQPGPHLLPTALIAGVYNNFASLDCTTTSGVPCAAQYIRTRCGKNGDLLGQKFTSTAWPLIFGPAGNNSNDAIVSQTSQFNGLGVSAGNVFTGFVHSVGTEQLSFTGPSVLDPSSPIPNQVIQLLNTPYTQAVFHGLNP